MFGFLNFTPDKNSWAPPLRNVSYREANFPIPRRQTPCPELSAITSQMFPPDFRLQGLFSRWKRLSIIQLHFIIDSSAGCFVTKLHLRHVTNFVTDCPISRDVATPELLSRMKYHCYSWVQHEHINHNV